MTNYDRLKNAITEIEKGSSYDNLVDVLQEFLEADDVTGSFTFIVEWLDEEHEITWEDVQAIRKTLKVAQKANILMLNERENCKSDYDWDTRNLLNDLANLLKGF